MWCRECNKVIGTTIKSDGKPDVQKLLHGWVATLKCGHVVLVPHGK